MADFPCDTSPVDIFSLEKLCLELIAQKFERFYFVFTESQESNVQRDLQYLQSKFSKELLTALYEGKYLKAKYLTLLINKHLKFLDGKWFEFGHCFESMQDIFCRLSDLTSVRFMKLNGDDEVLENVAKFCPKIVKIDVSHSKVTDDGVKYLCEIKNGIVSCPKIKEILIRFSGVTNRGIETLIRNLPSLEKIEHPNVPFVLHSIYTECLSKHQNVPYFHLVALNLFEASYRPFYSDILKACLTVCPKLESIGCRLTNEEQLDFFKNVHLKKASFRTHNPLSNIDSFLKVNGCHLTFLKLLTCSLSISELAKNCPLLEELSFADQVHFTDKDDQDAQVIFPSLIKCSFSCSVPPSDRAFTLLLTSSPKLESLSFIIGYNDLLPPEMKHQILLWCRNSFAKSIYFHQMKVEIKFLIDIILCSSLEEMGVVFCRVDNDQGKDILQNIAKSLHSKTKIFYTALNF